ncbi:glycosyltransferase family 2 protein, partial [Rhizobium johnstonii]
FVYDDTGTYRSWKYLSYHGLIQGEVWKYWRSASES